MPQRNLSAERRGIYYFGMALAGLGLVLFLSTFVTELMNIGDFSNFQGRVKSGMGRAFGGILCLALGQVMMRIGRSGVAGSGLKLDPEEARTDLEPWSRLSGGMLKDSLDEAGIDLSGPSREMPFDEQLRRLEALKRDGVLSEAEHAAAKAQILEGLGR